MKYKMAWAAAVAAALAVCGTASAQVAGDVIVRLGATRISPQVSSGNLTAPSFPNSKIDVNPDTELSGGITYMLTNNISFDLPLAMPFKHDIVGAGAVQGVGKIGETRVLPISLFAQYRFLEPKSALRPYVGLGLTYSRFYKERSTAALSGLTGGSPASPTTLSIANKFGLTPQIGLTYALSDRWSLDASYLKTFVKTTTTLSSGQTIKTTLNPDTISLGVGYRF